MQRKKGRVVVFVILGLAGLCLAAGFISFFINRDLLGRTETADRLSEIDLAHEAQATRLRLSLGSQVWPGWGEANIPSIYYNDAYAFLVGLNAPANGWSLPLSINRTVGVSWEEVTGQRMDYLRQPVKDGGRAIGAFVVRVGDTWVACLPTYAAFQSNFYQGFQQQLPPVVSEIFPFKIAQQVILGGSERYVTSMLHEMFHAFQANVALDRLVASEKVAQLEKDYPWDNALSEQAWKDELALLTGALKGGSVEETKSLVGQFLAKRQARRMSVALPSEMVNYERQREWLEGLAKYAELSIGLAAARAPGDRYLVGGIQVDPDFKGYSGYEQFYNMQMDQVGSLTNYKDETRFYYTGMAQAILLDRLMPGWKQSAIKDAFLEDLLADAVKS